MPDFKPPLSSSTTVRLPSTAVQVTVTFQLEASSIQTAADGGPTYQVWTDLLSTLREWRAIDFVEQENSEATALNGQDDDGRDDSDDDDVASWPVVPTSFESPSLVPTRRPLVARISVSLTDETHQALEGKYGFTYRALHPDGGVEWLGSDGSNGVVSVMSGEKEGWTRNGSEKETSSLTWTGHNEEVASSLGEGWTGFGVSLDEDDAPTGHLLPAPLTVPLVLAYIHASVNSPPFASFSNYPQVIAADPPASYLSAGPGSNLILKHTVAESDPSARLIEIQKRQKKAGKALFVRDGLAIFPLAGGTAVWSSAKGLFLVYSSLDSASVVPIPLKIPRSLLVNRSKSAQGTAVLAHDTSSIVRVDPGQGILLAQSPKLSKLSVVSLYSTLPDSALLIGPLVPASSSGVDSFEAKETTGTSSSSNSISPIEDALSEEEQDDKDSVVVEEAQSTFKAFRTLLSDIWNAILRILGFDNTVELDCDQQKIDEVSTGTTPLLSSILTTLASPIKSSIRGSTAAAATFLAPRPPISLVLTGSEETAALRFKGRPATATAASDWKTLSVVGEPEELNGDGSWWKIIIGLAEDGAADAGEPVDWEVQVVEDSSG